MPRKVRVLLIHNIMAPYRFPLFKALADRPDIDLTVWFMSRSAKNRMWRQSEGDLGFNYEVLPSFELSYFTRDLFAYIVNYSFPWRFINGRFDVLISAGWLDFACQVGFVLSRLLRRRFVMWSESTPYEPSLRRSLAAPLVKTMVRGADACIAVGSRSKQYLGTLGARDEDVFVAFSTVDVDHFRRGSAAARPERRRLQAALGIHRARVLLYCGQFIERKGLRYLIEAFALVKRQFDDLALVLIGYGPLRNELLGLATRLGVVTDVHVLDHVEVAEMPKMYALADLFILPSLEETWGLVVNEAMACGLPVIVTDRVGSSADLVHDGENGYVVPSADPLALADRVSALLADDALRERFGRCSFQRIEDFTPERAGQVFAAAVAHASLHR